MRDTLPIVATAAIVLIGGFAWIGFAQSSAVSTPSVADSPRQGDNAYPTFFNAVKQGDIRTVEQFLKVGLPPNIKSDDGEPALIVAVYHGRLDIIEKLLAAGAAVNASDKYGDTALTHAAYLGNAEICDVLLKGGADVNATDIYGETPLLKAERPAIVQKLLAAGASWRAKNRDGDWPLVRAGRKNQKETLFSLLDRSADIETRDASGMTVLAIAAEKNYVEILSALLGRGANIEARDQLKRTPLMAAAAEDASDTLDLLLKRGADINAIDDKGETAYDLADRKGLTRVQERLNRYGPRARDLAFSFLPETLDQPEAVAALAADFVRLGETDKAFAVARRLSTRPAVAFEAIAMALSRNGHPGEAAEKALPRFGDDQFSLLRKNNVYADLVETYAADSQFEKAETYLRKLDPSVFPQRQYAEAAYRFFLEEKKLGREAAAFDAKLETDYAESAWRERLRQYYRIKTLELRAAAGHFPSIAALTAWPPLEQVSPSKRAAAVSKALGAYLKALAKTRTDAEIAAMPDWTDRPDSPVAGVSAAAAALFSRQSADQRLEYLVEACAEARRPRSAAAFAARVSGADARRRAMTLAAETAARTGDTTTAEKLLETELRDATGEQRFRVLMEVVAAKVVKNETPAALALARSQLKTNEADLDLARIMARVALRLKNAGRGDHVSAAALIREGFALPRPPTKDAPEKP